LSELQPLLASTHHYAIWDDHDFGPNDSDRGFIHKDKTKKAFDLFWGNPSSGLPDNDYKGITTQFQWNDVDFFLLDNRYFRSPNKRKTGESTILGKEQLEWLIDALVTSNASFKMVAIGGQVLTTVENFETYIHNHAEERAYLLKRIEEENLKNVVFLTGDRHHTELSKIVNNRGNTVYDLTVSPLTSGSGSNRDEINKNRVEGTLRVQRNFGVIEVTGPWKERQLKMEIFDTDGKSLWTQEIKREP
jgi:alkaline phosphatase D